MDDTSFHATAQSEALPVNHEYSWHKVRWACMGCSMRRTGAGNIQSILRGFPHSLL